MIEETIRTRRSIRRFRPEAPSRAILEKLIEMAGLAPSASNRQPWRFLVIEDKDLIQRLAEAVATGARNIAEYVDKAFRAPFIEYSDNFSGFRQAPVVIVPIFRKAPLLSQMLDADTPAEWHERVQNLEYNSSLISIALAIENLMLHAHSIGLGTCAMTGPLLVDPEIRTMLEIAESWHIAAFIPVGYPEEMPEPTERKPLKQIIRWI